MNPKTPDFSARDIAICLIEESIKTLDQTPLRPYIDVMITKGYETALCAAAISGDMPNDYVLFLAMCEQRDYLSKTRPTIIATP